MDGFMAAVRLLPPELRAAAEALPECERVLCEELRLRRGRPAAALIQGREYVFSAPAVTEAQLRAVLETASRASLHAVDRQLCRGFVTAPGGVRVGVCGTAVMGDSGVEGLRCFSSLSLRVPRAVPGCADGIWPEIMSGGFRSTLIISPPGGGKTTLLRELIRRLSAAGLRLAVADERGEIAAAWSGEPLFDMGPETDVMTGVPKAEAAGMLLRSMNPQVIAMDEITDSADAVALLDAVGCGVRLLATVHGDGGSGGNVPPACQGLLEAGAFSRRIWVENRGGVRRYAVEDIPCA